MNLQLFPKIDLHYHLDGSVSPVTLIEIALQENIQLPTMNVDKLREYVQVEEECRNLAEYLTKFEISKKCMQSPRALKQVAYKAIEDVSKQNVRYIEVRFAPYLHTEQGLRIDEVVSNVLSGLKEGENDFATMARAILICMRNDSVEKNIEIIEVAAKFLDKGVVGVDLAGDEANFPPDLNKDAFNLAKKYNIPITIHAGEAAGSENIYDAVVNLGAKRIGHGIRLKEDPHLVELIKEKKITLELCPTSNVQTKAVDSWESHPIKYYFDKGILVTVNTDNTTVSNTNITNEYRILVERYGFILDELKEITFNSLNAAFINNNDKQKLKKILEKEYKIIGL
ncbi:adenosine deaminase [Vallitalea maricola]|uniref:Adenosine deaminase n=1 Tax=Vallitalea maricola TaxID=3074433 RepID=A0ACB5UI20_9FIRM|nr:adenosine deaminase [Vallitalea sp. AN17-2]